jgi:anaerobic selenocysteine-containing dehydrogenase/Fe-S-cluster-containing dehydrogenase component
MPELDRRSFLKVVGMSAGAVATTACKEPVEKVIPYLNQPEEIIPGIPTYYASTCRECPGACGITVKTREGRPIKVDGNPEDPISRGALCARGQVSLSRTYDPDRFRSPMKRGPDGQLVATTWDDALATLQAKLSSANKSKVFFLGGLETGTLDTLIDGFMAALGSTNRMRFEPFAYESLRAANRLLFGSDAVPQFRFELADFVLSFGSDFLETWGSPLANQRGYADGRKGGKGFAVHIGPRLSMSGASCDMWLSAKPGTEILVALALAGEVARAKSFDLSASGIAPVSIADAAQRSGIKAEELTKLAGQIAKAQAPLAIPPGLEVQGPNATAFAAAVQLLNAVSGALNKTVVFGPDQNIGKLARFADIVDLAGKMRGGDVEVLFVHNANPVYAARQAAFADALKQNNVFVVSFSSANDETTAAASLVLPDHTPYESWGDAEPVLGLRRLQQPTINPIFDTRAIGDVLVDIAQKLGVGQTLGTQSFLERLRAAWGAGFDAALGKGGVFEPAAPRQVALGRGAAGLDFQAFEPAGAGDLTLVVYPSLHFYDGRSARFPVLQEIPDPVTKLVWGSFAEIHPETAKTLGVATGDVVTVTTQAGSVELPVFVHLALRKDVVAIMAGQGHQPVKPDAADPDWFQRRKQIGVNALDLLPAQLDASGGGPAWLATRVQVASTGRMQPLAMPQATFDQERRGIARFTTLAALAAGGKDGEHGAGHGAGHGAAEAGHGAAEADHGAGHGEEHSAGHGDPQDAGYAYTTAADAYADAGHLPTVSFLPENDALSADYRWGMVIDLDACGGCNACVAACTVENNVATVGEEVVRKGREMHWIQIERYIEPSDRGEGIEVYHTAMLCQHCGAAPCESVCPVYATYHNDEGLNVMVPNRCIGTRYCGNNCPYKVRRFNYYAYDWYIEEPANLQLNPDVMVRSKGVMEKCTFCVQRINAAKDQATIEGRKVRDGDFTVACAQACPSQAITFGNHKAIPGQPESQVNKLRQDPRAYWVLPHLNTRPGVTYLKAIRRESEEA